MGNPKKSRDVNRLAQNLPGSMSDEHRKNLLRKVMREKIATNPDSDSAPIVEQIKAYLENRPHMRVVGMFAALLGEVNLRALSNRIERVWVYPRMEGESLTFHEVKNFEIDLRRGAFGVLEPNPDLKSVGIGEVDVFLCPGLAFDLKGGRIGRGKGFYDRMLGNARPSAPKLGVCFRYQIVPEIVMEDHDVRMDAVITG